jgi:hypothetical protein
MSAVWVAFGVGAVIGGLVAAIALYIWIHVHGFRHSLPGEVQGKKYEYGKFPAIDWSKMGNSRAASRRVRSYYDA